jgi:hypothetical protein
MSKRKLPPAPKLWARLVGGRDWEIYLPKGETLRPIRALDKVDGARLARTNPVFLIAYIAPVRDLTGASRAIEDALADVDAEGLEHNTLHLYGSREGTQAVVFEHHH